jgi:NLI interacting factor-like phosphatase
MSKRIAFDLDETLGVPIVDQDTIVGFRARDGATELLGRLKQTYALVLWTVSDRRYAEKALSYGLRDYFDALYCWDDLPVDWKDIRRIGADYLVDDNEYHRDEAMKRGVTQGYIVVPAYGCRQDSEAPLAWVGTIERALA